ncbi:hypothetical protein LINPERPRIM_LOCUS37385 [Linum perenne]
MVPALVFHLSLHQSCNPLTDVNRNNTSICRDQKRGSLLVR